MRSAIIAAFLLASGNAGSASTYCVDNAGDPSFGNAANCVANCCTGAVGAVCTGACQLRDAVAAVATGDSIQFTRAMQLTLNQQLDIGKAITISGYAGAPGGATPNTSDTAFNGKITVDIIASNAIGVAGLELDVAGVTVSGLALHGFHSQSAIDVYDAGTVTGNFIGIDASGNCSASAPSAGACPTQGCDIGVELFGTNAVVGGTAPADRNVIACCGTGVYPVGNGYPVAPQHNQVIGNLIGTDPSGEYACANNDGVFVSDNAIGNIIGGWTTAERNVISGNNVGVGIDFGAVSNRVQGNFIGLSASGAALPNTGDGIFVLVGVGNTFSANAVSNNGGLGIDLGAGGNTNDAGDADTGPNDLQNFPLLSAATTVGGTTVVNGTLNSVPSATFSIDFFSNPTACSGAACQAATYLGTVTTTTDAGGAAAIYASVNAADAAQSNITATATNADGSTSEIGPATAVASLSVLALDVAAAAVAQTDGNLTITVHRTGPSAGAVSAHLDTTDKSAISATDYTGVSTIVTFADGDNTDKTIDVAIANSGATSAKIFVAALSQVSGAALIGAPNREFITIDAAPGSSNGGSTTGGSATGGGSTGSASTGGSGDGASTAGSAGGSGGGSTGDGSTHHGCQDKDGATWVLAVGLIALTRRRVHRN